MGGTDQSSTPPAGISIRSPRFSDKGGLERVYLSDSFNEFVSIPPDKATIAATVDANLGEARQNPRKFIFRVASHAQAVAGFAICYKKESGSWGLQVGVHADARRRGIGTALLREMFYQMERRGPGCCEAVVHPRNLASLRLLTPFFHDRIAHKSMAGFLMCISRW
ncbi:N-acetyltransferase family protein [Bradyrhizobium sp. Arg314]